MRILGLDVLHVSNRQSLMTTENSIPKGQFGQKRWFYTASALSGLGLRTLPRSKRAIARLAKLEGWPFATRRGRGGREIVFPVSSLPESAQKELVERTAPSPEAIEALALGSPDHDGYAAACVSRRDRMAVRVQALAMVRAAVAAGWTTSTAVSNAATTVGYDERSVWRWLRKAGSGKVDPVALLPGRNGPEPGGFTPIHPEAWKSFIDDYLRQHGPSFSACYRRLLAAAKDNAWGDIPSCDSMRRRLKATVLLEVQRDELKR